MSIEYSPQQEIDVNEFMGVHGIDDEMAQREVFAHGRMYSVAEAIAQCEPFRVQIEATVGALNESIPDEDTRKTIISNVLNNTIEKLAVGSQETQVNTDFLAPKTAKTL
jgi:hypothetical protein